MDFLTQVTALNEAPPRGWKARLSLAEHVSLPANRTRYYEPLYARYRTKKIRDYDPDYGKFVGWKPIEVGVGEPIGYKYIGYLAAKVIDSVLASNVFMSRIVKKNA